MAMGHGLTGDRAVTRREAIAIAGGGLGAIAGGRAVDNVLLGYGDVVGTNLRAQAASGALASLVSEGLLADERAVQVHGSRLVSRDDTLMIRSPDGTEIATLSLSGSTLAEARGVDHELGLDGATSQIFRDLRAIQTGEFTVAFSQSEPFFDRAQSAAIRPYIVGLARGQAAADSADVAAFTDVDPAGTPALVSGLVDGFRTHTYYDVPRYLAGSIQDNVLFGAVDLRRFFRDPVDFESLSQGEPTGVFCYEYVARSREAFQAVPAPAQTVPVIAGLVHDGRHKHAYTVLATVIREKGELVIPVTFLDYTHATLYDDLRVRGLMGEGVEAYNDRHRAGTIRWS